MAEAAEALGDIARAHGYEALAVRHYTESQRLYTILHSPAAERLARQLAGDQTA